MNGFQTALKPLSTCCITSATAWRKPLPVRLPQTKIFSGEFPDGHRESEGSNAAAPKRHRTECEEIPQRCSTELRDSQKEGDMGLGHRWTHRHLSRNRIPTTETHSAGREVRTLHGSHQRMGRGKAAPWACMHPGVSDTRTAISVGEQVNGGVGSGWGDVRGYV